MNWDLPPTDTYFRNILSATPRGFEIDHLDAALEHCHRFRCAVDGGAHIGTWSVNLAPRFSRVMAFEPALDSYQCLVANTVYHAKISTHNAALGAKKGQCIVIEDPTRQGNSGSRQVLSVDETSHLLRIPILALDSFNLTDLDFLKLDVEGFEIEALRGAVGTLFTNRPVLMIECKEFNPPRNGGVTVVRQFLAGEGYIEVGGVRNDRIFIPA